MVKTFLKLGIPAAITNFLDQMGQTVTQLVFAGTLEDPINLAAVGLAVSVSACVIYAVLIGLNTAQY